MPLPFVFQIRHFKEIDSTNDYAKRQAETRAPEGEVYFADFQTGGRGQFERKWVSPAGKNLLFSVLLRPPLSPAEAPILTQIACRSVAEALRAHYGIACTIKKPNDLLVNGRKICGILTEATSSSPKKVESVIIGAGLNVNQAPEGLDAISMKEILGKELLPAEVLNQILAQLGKDLETIYAK